MIDFIGIGGQKCGTTWMFHHLQSLPDVRFPAGKEVHYWDNRRGAGVAHWLGQFPDIGASMKQGEITPAYAILNRATIAELHRTAPDVRLFLSVRNPLERAWSAALMFLNRCRMEPGEASDQWFLDLFKSRNSKRMGDFSRSLDRWRDAFGSEQLNVIVYDDISIDPRSVLIALAQHIGVDHSPFAHSENRDLGAVIRPNNFGPIDDEVLARTVLRSTLLAPLRDIYGDEVGRLSTMLQRDLSHWLEWDGSR